MRIGSLNVHGWADAKKQNNLKRIGAFLSDRQVDVLCLQEACSKQHGVGAARDLGHFLGT